ncbi:hypothetical protein F7725_014481, partial [Dissostichus mawsoni]
MLTDMIVEQEFDIKEEEPWYDKQDLEHDLQLAAELGKSLLERNRELEQGLQQMYSTNQEQLQEIEYLTKQVDLLRHVNDQHAKVYEQLDVAARELELSNRKLVQDNRASQQKIQGYDYDDPSDGLEPPDMSWHEEEQASLRQSLRSLQTQFAGERARREQSEREAELLAGENAALEHQLAGMEGCKTRVTELEREAEELRHLWKSDSSTRSSRPDNIHSLLPNSMFLNPEEESEEGAAAAKSPWALKSWDSERLARTPQTPHRVNDHECSCVRRAEVVKYRGISLLNEVDAQYSALQVKYDELLRRCQPGQQEEEDEDEEEEEEEEEGEERRRWRRMGRRINFKDDFNQPEYKELFREIFSRIQKTKEDLIENRGRASAGSQCQDGTVPLRYHIPAWLMQHSWNHRQVPSVKKKR